MRKQASKMLRDVAQMESADNRFYRDTKKTWNKLTHKEKGVLTNQYKKVLKHD